MAVKVNLYDSAQGGWVEYGTVSVTPGSISAASQVVSTATVTGAKTGDLIFVNAEALPTMAACVGGKITSANTLSLYFNNMYDATTAVTVNATTVDYMLVHLT